MTPSPRPHRRRRRSRGLTSAAVLVAAALAVASVPPRPAGAVAGGDDALATGAAAVADDAFTTGTDAGPLRLHVRRIPLAVGPALGTDSVRIRVVVDNSGDVAVDVSELVIALHPAVADRDDLTAALLDGPRTVASRTRRSPVGEVAPGGLVAVDLEVPMDGLGLPGEDAEGDGSTVHPVTLSLIAGGSELATLRTAIVRLTGTPTAPLLTTVVAPYSDAPWRGPGDAYPVGIAAPVRPGGRLDAVLTGLEQRPGARVVLAPAGHVLEDLADRADGFPLREQDGSVSLVPGDDAAALVSASTLDRLRQLGATLALAPIAGPYGDADLAALARSGPALRGLATTAALDGPERAKRVLGREVEATTTLDAPVDPVVLDLVAGDVVLVPGAAVTPSDAELARHGAALRTVRSPEGRTLAVLVADADLTALVARPDVAGGPIHAAHLVAMLTAATQFEDAATAGRTVLVLPPRDWAPSPALVAELVARLDVAPWLRLDGPAAIALIGRPEPEPLRLLGEDATPLPDAVASGLGSARDELDALERALPASAVTTPDGRERTVGGMRDELVRATSGWWTGATGTPVQALVDDVIATSELGLGGVELGLGDVTLTARDGVVPITLTRTAGAPIDVIVELSGPAALVWPEGRRSATLRLEPGVETTVAIPTTTRSTGVFAVRVRVAEPAGERTITAGTVSVRATAASGPALLAIAGLVVLLLAGSAARARRRGTVPDAGHGDA